MPKQKFTAVLLAAGNSSRMSDWKPGVLLNEEPLLYYSLETLSKVCRNIIVVGGFKYEELSVLVNQCASTLNADIICVYNKDYESGMLTSVKTGMEHAVNENFFIALSDMPFVKEGTYRKLLDMKKQNPNFDVIFPVVEIEGAIVKKGHPVLISSIVKKAILNSVTTIKLRDIFKEFRCGKCKVEDEGIIFDIDTDADLEKAKRIFTLR